MDDVPLLVASMAFVAVTTVCFLGAVLKDVNYAHAKALRTGLNPYQSDRRDRMRGA